MSSKSKQRDKSLNKSRKNTANLSPVVEFGEDDDIIDSNNYHSRQLGLGLHGWDQSQSSVVDPPPLAGTQPSNRYNHATTNDNNFMTSAIMRSPPPSAGMIYCQNIIVDDTQTEGLNINDATNTGDSGNRFPSNSPTNNSQFPLTSFEEADLLQRAIERRAFLREKVEAMESAKAQFGEGGNASQHRWDNRHKNQFSTTPQQIDDDRQKTTTSTEEYQRQRQRPHQLLDETSSSRYQSTSMRHPPPTADSQSFKYRVTHDPSDYNLKNNIRPFDEDGQDSSDGCKGNGTRDDRKIPQNDTMIPQRRSENHHQQRMTQISERIKKDALEFMSHESSYADKKERLTQQLEGVRRSKERVGEDGLAHNINGSSIADEMGSDHAVDEIDSNHQISSFSTRRRHNSPRIQGPDYDSPIAGQQRSSPTKVDSAATIDSSAWSGGNPTTQQRSRYSNMVRLGIPDVAVIRSMERDGMSNSQSLLQSLKVEHGNSLQSSAADTSDSSSAIMQYVRQSSLVSNSSSSSDINNASAGKAGDNNEGAKQVASPLRDDPNYSKYFKMLKAKVPPSWVKRVLEVDGKDSRVLDLDPNLPLAEQLPGSVDKLGNIDWSSVNIDRSASSNSKEYSDVDNKVVIDTFASVKAELASMRAKAGELSNGLRKVPSDESLPTSGAPKTNKISTAADICSEAVAASNSRTLRLNAIRAGGGDKSSDGLGVKRRTVDEIRRRPPQLSTSTTRHTIPRPTSSPKSSKQSGSITKQSYDDLPLKDDPRFSKYFQMIRSRVPRSWVERVIEVDDRDPAILDLDPNKSLASQIGEETSDVMEKDENETIASTAPSMDASGISGISRKTRDSSPAAISEQSNKKANNLESGTEVLPPNQIFDYKNDDDKSDASSITTFREIQGDRSNLDTARILTFLNRIEAQLSDQSGEVMVDSVERPAPPRFTDADEVERKLTELIEKFETKKVVEARTDVSHEHTELMEKSRAVLTKLSSLLGDRSSLSDDADVNKLSEQSSLENLPALLTLVLEKLEKSSLNVVTDSTETSENKDKDKGEQPMILCEDPKYAKYFKMLKLGLPRTAVIQALERDEQDVAILDMDPYRPYADQKTEVDEQPKAEENADLKALFAKRAHAVKDSNKHVALEALFAKRVAATHHEDTAPPMLKDDPEFQKYMRMLKIGMPKENVRQALVRDGKDQAVADMDPDKPYSSQITVAKSQPPVGEAEEYAKFFKMLKMGIPIDAVRHALQKEGKDPKIIDMDPSKSYDSQTHDFTANAKVASPALKDDPEFSKFFKMLKLGIPLGAVRQALQKEGKDPSIVDMDPELSYLSQAKGNECSATDNDAEPLLKDDPELGKFFKMLKMGMPLGAVQNALKKEGKDINIVNLDPEMPLSRQVQPKVKEEETPKITRPKGVNVARKRIHWNKIDESKLAIDSFWNQAKEHSSLQLVGLDFDNEEFASLFTSPVKNHTNPEKSVSATSKATSKQKVQLIDGRRRMNGSILLTKFKVDYKTLARQVDTMEHIEAEGNELRGMLQLLPTKDEALALRSYLPPQDAPQSEIDESISKLGECEQYMAVMLDVPDVKDKFQCMVFRAEFESHADSIRDGTTLLIQACECVKNSERFRKVLLYALKLGNALNTGGSNEEVRAITLDSLLKLAEAKAFDRQTSVLHYLVSIVQKNDEDVLNLSDDFVPVKAAERVSMEMLAQQLKELQHGIELVHAVAKRYLPESVTVSDDSLDNEILGATSMGQFALSAAATIETLSNDFTGVKNSFADLLQFFGEESTMSPEVFFCTINTFVSLFDQTHKELKRKEEAKERKKRIEDRKKQREQEVAAK